MKKIVIIFVSISIVFILCYWWAIRHKSSFESGQSQYEQLRSQAYAIVNAQNFDALAFKNFLKQQNDYHFYNWPREFWYSLTFADPRGDVTLYQDLIMSVALGLDRLQQVEQLAPGIKKKIIGILNRRTYLWHDWPWENHYAREYAALAALAETVGDPRLSRYQNKLHKSLTYIFKADGSSTEGVAYGYYNLNLLVPYYYISGDEWVKNFIINFYNWTANLAAADGELPPFGDSHYLKLPTSLSSFNFVNTALPGIALPIAQSQDYYGPNETVIKKQSYTLWLRHQQKLSGKTYHSHYSAGEIIFKTAADWWLVPSGYYNNGQKLNKPYLYNLASRRQRRSNWGWRLRSILGKDYRTNFRKENKEIQLILPDKIIRRIDLGEEGFTVVDENSKIFYVYWHILGEIVERNKLADGLELVFKQNQNFLQAKFKGYDEILISQERHTLPNPHYEKDIFIQLKGKKIQSQFSL